MQSTSVHEKKTNISLDEEYERKVKKLKSGCVTKTDKHMGQLYKTNTNRTATEKQLEVPSFCLGGENILQKLFSRPLAYISDSQFFFDVDPP